MARPRVSSGGSDDRPPLALTFDDVLLLPARSRAHPRDVDLRTRLTDAVPLHIPIVSAAMDTVTESRLAIAMAQQGGLGVIHKNLSIAAQAEEVDRVKRSESGMIVDPVTVRPEQKIAEALELMARYKISGVPVIDEKGKLVGILTNRDLRFETRPDRPISSRMTKERLITTPVGTTLEQAKELLHRHRIEKLLVVDRNGNLKGLITVKDIQKAIKYPSAAKDRLGRLRVGAAVGVANDLVERASELVRAHVDVLVLDSSHGHSQGVLDALKLLRKKFSSTPIIAGNVATEEGARDLVRLGADAVKVGIGPAGETILYQGRTFKAYRGMGSLAAMKSGSSDRYFQESMGVEASTDASLSKLVPEGIEGMVPYKGSVEGLVHQLTGGLRSGMGLTGARTIEELRTKSKMVRVTSAGLKESHPHDVIITKEAPNYRREEG